VEGVSWNDLKDADGFLARTGLFLPSEAQWEYACRAGQVGPYSGTGVLDDMGWYEGNMACFTGRRSTQPVGGKSANQFGLHDMHGNVIEWCEDAYALYSAEARVELIPVAKRGVTPLCVTRGGYYCHNAKWHRSAARLTAFQQLRNLNLGFRPVIPLPIVVPGFTPVSINAQGRWEFTHDSSGIRFVHLPGGSFDMGSPETEPNRGSNEGPVHTVSLSPFLIAKYEMTQAEYEAVMTGNTAGLNAAPSQNSGSAPPSVQRPVESVSWDDLHLADGFLERTGLSLPSEAQWEYAARAGTQTAFSFGDDCNANSCDPCATADDYMWWCGNDGGSHHPVGTKQANQFGLHDMHGNVWEWCEDVYDSAFYGKPEAVLPNPLATSGSGGRVFRGGDFRDSATLCRSASRPDSRVPSVRFGLGFRPARPLP
jgi:formylglycine-generating enzyme required for sulfatase activity